MDASVTGAVSRDWTNNASDEAFSRLYEASQKDDEQACLELGKCYVYGPPGFHKDILLGEFYLAKAARQGNKEAVSVMSMIPELLSQGPTENRDEVWIKEASAKLEKGKDNRVLPRIPVGSFIYITKKLGTHTSHTLVQQSQSALMDTLRSVSTKVWSKEEIVNLFGDSPTARQYAKAIELMQSGYNIFVNPQNKEDRFKLVEGLHLYMEGHSYEPMAKHSVPLLQRYFDKVDALITDTLKENKNDFACRFLRICMDSEIEPYRSNSEDLIVALEILVNDINSYPAKDKQNQDTDRVKMIKCDALEFLAALYFTSHQYLRSKDSFRKCIEIFPSHAGALYGLAFIQFNVAQDKRVNDAKTSHLNEREKNVTELNEDYSKDITKAKSESAFKRYLDIAPKCHRKYHFALYMSAVESLLNNNSRGMVDLYEMAVEVEKKSLPMYQMQNKPAGYDMVVAMYPFVKSRLCANKNCTIQSNDPGEVQRSPPGKRCSRCKMVRYCTSDCQVSHWPEHKVKCKRMK